MYMVCTYGSVSRWSISLYDDLRVLCLQLQMERHGLYGILQKLFTNGRPPKVNYLGDKAAGVKLSRYLDKEAK